MEERQVRRKRTWNTIKDIVLFAVKVFVTIKVSGKKFAASFSKKKKDEGQDIT